MNVTRSGGVGEGCKLPYLVPLFNSMDGEVLRQVMALKKSHCFPFVLAFSLPLVHLHTFCGSPHHFFFFVSSTHVSLFRSHYHV